MMRENFHASRFRFHVGRTVIFFILLSNHMDVTTKQQPFTGDSCVKAISN